MAFNVPRNHQFNATWLYLNGIKSSGGGSPVITFKGFVYSDVTQSEFEVFTDGIDTSVIEHIQLNTPEPFVIGEKSILWFTASSTTNNASVRGRFSGKLISLV